MARGNDFRQGSAAEPSAYTQILAMRSRDDLLRLLRWSGLAIWAVVGAPVLLVRLTHPGRGLSSGMAAWTAAFALFGVALVWNTSLRRRPAQPRSAVLAAAQSIAALSLMALPQCFGLEGVLLVLVAFELG